jgi:hypothetical protein
LQDADTKRTQVVKYLNCFCSSPVFEMPASNPPNKTVGTEHYNLAY